MCNMADWGDTLYLDGDIIKLFSGTYVVLGIDDATYFADLKDCSIENLFKCALEVLYPRPVYIIYPYTENLFDSMINVRNLFKIVPDEIENVVGHINKKELDAWLTKNKLLNGDYHFVSVELYQRNVVDWYKNMKKVVIQVNHNITKIVAGILEPRSLGEIKNKTNKILIILKDDCYFLVVYKKDEIYLAFQSQSVRNMTYKPLMNQHFDLDMFDDSYLAYEVGEIK